MLKTDAEESPAAGLAGPPIGQLTALVGELMQPQLEDAGARRALLHRGREKEGGKRSVSAGGGAQAEGAAGGAERARDVTCGHSTASSSSAQRQALWDADVIPRGVLSTRGLRICLRGMPLSRTSARLCRRVPEKLIPLGTLLPRRLLENSVAGR